MHQEKSQQRIIHEYYVLQIPFYLIDIQFYDSFSTKLQVLSMNGVLHLRHHQSVLVVNSLPQQLFFHGNLLLDVMISFDGQIHITYSDLNFTL